MYNNINVHLCRHYSNAHDNYDDGMLKNGAHLLVNKSIFRRDRTKRAYHIIGKRFEKKQTI